MINEELAKAMNLDAYTVFEIQFYQNWRSLIEEEMELIYLHPNDDDDDRYKRILKSWVDTNYKLQELWGFDKNPLYHPQYQLPYCTCPEMDNRERLGYGFIRAGDCPIHTDSEYLEILDEPRQ